MKKEGQEFTCNDRIVAGRDRLGINDGGTMAWRDGGVKESVVKDVSEIARVSNKRVIMNKRRLGQFTCTGCPCREFPYVGGLRFF